MKKILIAAEYFAPINAIPSIRVTKIAKYLKLNGYYIGVVSRKMRYNEIIDPFLQNDLKYIDEHICICESIISRFISYIYKLLNISNSKIIIISKTKHLKIILSKIFDNLSKTFNLYFNTLFLLTKSYSKRASKIVKKIAMAYDVIITSYGPFSAINLGYIAKINNPNLLWIIDFRDPLYNDINTILKGNNYYNLLKNKVIGKADIITGVSDGCIEEFNNTFNGKMKVIYNGYDREDIINLEKKINNKFSFTYAGALYKDKSDLSIIFKILNELIIENKICKDKVEVNYLGPHEKFFFNQADAYNMTDICNSFGKVNRKDSLKIQLNSHILLLASWNNIGETGVVTGKFLEYMMINKPIICTITGNLPNSQLKQMIKTANNGITWEQANDEKDYPAIKEYILKQYERYINNLPLIFEPNMQYIEQFNYNNITKEFIKIIEEFN